MQLHQGNVAVLVVLLHAFPTTGAQKSLLCVCGGGASFSEKHFSFGRSLSFLPKSMTAYGTTGQLQTRGCDQAVMRDVHQHQPGHKTTVVKASTFQAGDFDQFSASKDFCLLLRGGDGYEPIDDHNRTDEITLASETVKQNVKKSKQKHILSPIDDGLNCIGDGMVKSSENIAKSRERMAEAMKESSANVAEAMKESSSNLAKAMEKSSAIIAYGMVASVAIAAISNVAWCHSGSTPRS